VSGTTTRALTTVFARGTASYRAPELLKEHPVYTNKVDIWAIGCILFELVTGKVAFTGDWEVHEFAVSGSKIQLPNSSFPKLFQTDVSTSVDAILRPDPPQRPDATHICSKFRSYIEQLSTNPEPLSEAKLDPYEPRADDSEAIADWKGLVKRNPNSLPLQKRLSDAYRKEGKLDLEIAILERIVNKDPSSVYYSDMLTEAYDKRRKVQGWSDQSEVEENDKHPEDWVVVDESSEIVESKPPRKASDGKDIAYWKERVYKKPGDLDLQTSLVKAFRKQGDIEGEIATFNDLIRRFPSAWYLADQVANAYKEKGDMDEAIENWIDLVHMEPANTWWQVRLAEAYEIKKDKAGEIQTWRDFVKMYPDIESLQDRLATAYERT
jgi:serine/threonine protein kinase